MIPVKVNCLHYRDDYAEISVEGKKAYLSVYEDGRQNTVVLDVDGLVALLDAASAAIRELEDLAATRPADANLDALTDPAPEAETEPPPLDIVGGRGAGTVINIFGDVHL